MRKFLSCLICLLMLFPAAAQAHLLTAGRGHGTCRTLQGDVPLLVIFVDTPQAQWDDTSLFRTRISDAAAALEAEAARYGVPLSLTPEYFSARTSVTDIHPDPWPLAEEAIAAVPGIASRLLKAQSHSLELPILICMPQGGRSLAYTVENDDLEYAVLFADTTAGSICHELLHLFGARDLYLHQTVKASAQALFPDSIMLESSIENTVDSFTAWCIGWTAEPNESAARLMADTAHLTPSDLEAAMADSLYTGMGTQQKANGVYTGMLVNGEFHGTGTFEWDNGSTYTGQWVSGRESGYGVFTWSSGTSYAGDFLDGKRTGYGVIIWPDGSSYAGSFWEDQYHGQGVYTAPDGSVTEGVWEYGVLVE